LTGLGSLANSASVAVNATFTASALAATTINNFSGGGAGLVNLPTGSLTLTQSSALTYAGAFAGGGSIEKNGTAQLQLTGASPGFSGTLNVNAGEIKLNGSLGGHVTVDSGALFSGNATIGGTLTNSGTVAAGNSVGIINVATLVLNPGSLLEVEIDDDLTNDQIFATGTASVDGALNVTFLPGVYLPGMSYTIIEALGGVSGNFASRTDNSTDFDLRVTKTATQVILTIVDPRSEIFFQLPLVGNALTVADNIVAINMAGQLVTDPDLFHVIDSLVGQSFAVVESAMIQLDPTPYTTLGATSALVSPMLTGFYAPKTRNSCCPGYHNCSLNKWDVWLEPFRMHFHQQPVHQQNGFRANASGVALGVENGLDDEWKIGVGWVYNRLTIHWQNGRGHSESNNFYGALFADREWRSMHFACALLGGGDLFSNRRNIRFASIDRTAESNYVAGELIGKVSLAYCVGPENKRLNLYAAIDSDTLFEPSFREHGANSVSLKMDRRATSVLVSEAGVLFKARWDISGGCWGTDIWAAYVNETFVTRGRITSTFVNQVIPFTTIGVHTNQNLLEVGLTTSWLFNDRVSFSGTFSPQFGFHLSTQRGDFRIRWIF
jgi:uncharacterized protein with beta-barrel porin domain